MKIDELPDKIPVFPLSNFIIFPKTSVPLNIFEPRYIDMINDSMKSNKLVGMIQPKIAFDDGKPPELYDIGCAGKITTFKETDDGRYLIFHTINEIKSANKYREFKVNFNEFKNDLENEKVQLKFSDLELIFKDLKTLFEKRGFVINWKALEKQSLDETINALAMASPFSLEEKQVLLESKSLNVRKDKISEILKTYSYDNFDNTTLQ